jgi:dihydrofolate reductase
VEGWGGSHPVGVPVFVVTHHVPEQVPKGTTTFTFVTDGIESAIDQAKAAAGEKNVGVAGANIARQCIKVGLVDEIHIHLVPVLLGEGI